MSIFYNKLVESAVADNIQGPTAEDIGNDLKQIEDNIMGPDGIAAHADEVEDAAEGVVGDPVEEFAFIMYESEYNFNQIMKCIGMAELHEMVNGKEEFILEGSNLTGFFDNMAKMFKNMFARITELFKVALTKMQDSVNIHKNFVKKYDSAIINGFDKEWEVEAYDMDALNIDYTAKDFISDNEYGTTPHAKIIKHVTGVDIQNEEGAFGEMQAKLKDQIFVKKTYKSSDNDTKLRDEVRNILNGNDDIKAVKSAYDKVKESYKNALNMLKKAHSELSKKGADEADKKDQSAVLASITCLKYEKQCQDAMFTQVLKARKIRRAQAFRLAMKWKSLGEKKDKGDGKKPVAESSIFNIDII